MMVPIIFSEIFDHKPTLDELHATVARLDWRYIITLSVGIASTSWQRGIENPAQQQDLAVNTLRELDYAPQLFEIMTSEPYRRIYTREALFAIAKVAILDRKVVDGPTNDAMDALVQAVLMANELTADELLPTSLTHTASDLTKSEVRSHVLRLQNPNDLLARTAAFMQWSETAEARQSPNCLPVSTDIARFFDVSWMEFAASAYVMLSRYAALIDWAAVEREKIFFAPDVYLQNLKEDAPLRRWLHANTISVEMLADAWRNDGSVSFASAGPLWRTPMIGSEDTMFIASPSLLTNAMGEGVYFALFDSYGIETGDSKKKLRLSRFYGEFFESYITTILQRAYAGHSDTDVYPNFSYSGGDSTDIIIIEGRDVFFVEVVSKRMKVIDSILKLDEQAILDDIAEGVVKKIRELHKHIGNFRERLLLPDVSRPADQRIFPIVVSPNDWPRIRILSEILPNLQSEEGLLSDTQPLELLDAGEVESLESDIKRGLRVGDLLARKNGSTPQNRMMTLNNYLIYIEPTTTTDEQSPTRVRGSEIAKEIVAMAMSWFKSAPPPTSPA